MKFDKKHAIDDLETSIGCFFLDSGAHSLYNTFVLKRRHIKREDKWDMYQSKDFEKYVNSYVKFVKKFQHAIDYYVSIDVIFNPELSWRNLKLLESKGINPIPVIHHGTPLKWIEKHLEEGYEFLGIGGLGQEVTVNRYYAWADKVFDMLCPASNGFKPIVRTHGFAMTSYNLIMRYPWWSVDSASWIKAAAYGMIYIPKKHKGEFAYFRDVKVAGETSRVYDIRPSSYSVSSLFDKKKTLQKKDVLIESDATLIENYEAQPRAVKALINDWLEFIGIPLGSVDKEGKMVEYGVLSHHKARAHANLLYFQTMADSKGAYEEQTFKSARRKGFFE